MAPEELLKKFEALNTFPSVAMHISHLASDENCNIRELEKIILRDPSLAESLLQLVNSSYFGLLTKVDSMEKARLFLGIRNIRNIVMVNALKEAFNREVEYIGYSRRNLWHHSVSVGVCCQLIYRRLLGKSGEDAFLAGILHDLGLLVEEQYDKYSFLKAIEAYRMEIGSLTACEHSVLGTDHCEVGTLLVKDWNLPAEVKNIIRHHHKVIRDPREIETMLGAIQVAHYLVSGFRTTEVLEHFESPKGLVAEHIRLQSNEYKVLAEEIPRELEKAQEIFGEAKDSLQVAG